MANITKIDRAKGITYRIRVGNGYDVDGRQKTKSMNWTPDPGMTEKQIQKELNRVVVEFERKVSDGSAFDNIKFYDLSMKWLDDYARKKCSPKYVAECERMLGVVNKEIGHIPAPKLRKTHLQEFYNKLAEEPIVNERKKKKSAGSDDTEEVERYRSPSTILHYHRLISTILTKGNQWEYIQNNICLGKGLELPKQKKYQPHYLQDTEVLKLAESLVNAPIEYRTIILLLLYTGMRNGEAMGLEWKDIDFENNLVSINKSSQYIAGVGVFTKETKNTSSERTIQVVPELIELLKQYKVWQNEQRLQRGILWKSNPENTDDKHCDRWNTCKKKNGTGVYCRKEDCKNRKTIDRLFTQFNGIPIHPETPRQWLKKFIDQNDLPSFNIHSLRHTNISLMLMQGIPIASVARLAGHSSPATTTKLYSHSIQTAEQLAIEKVANVINPSRKAK